MIMIGDGKPTTVLLEKRRGTTHGEHGLNGLNAVLNVVALVQDIGHEGVFPPSWEAMNVRDKLTQRQRIVMPQHAGQILESGLIVLENVIPLDQGTRPGLASLQQMVVNPAQI